MVDALMRGSILAGVAILAIGAAAAAPKQAPAGKLNTEAFLAACVADPVVTDEPGLAAGGKVTPQIYCDCITGKFGGKKLTQADVDMLTKMHKDEITDEDGESYPTLEDLMATHEGFEDACKASLGMPASTNDQEEEAPSDEGPPADEEDIPQNQ
jgi:hypothetical protein